MHSKAAVGDAASLVHEVAFYDSDDDFLSIVVPFLDDGLATDEPTVVALGRRNADLVRSALPTAAGITFLPNEREYFRPASTVRTFREMFRAHVDTAPGRLRVLGEVLGPMPQTGWEPWVQYEAAVNAVYNGFPVWCLCTYNTQTTPDIVLADAQRTHPQVATTDGRHLVNNRYQDPLAFLADRPQPDPDPLESTAPVVELVNPTPAAGRQAIAHVARCSQVERGDVADLGYGVSEAVTNAHMHGRPPVVLRAWAALDRLVIVIRDSGTGPTEPFTGLVPANNGVGGLGLWITHQMRIQVAHITTDDGFAIRLTAGTPKLS